MSTRCPPETMKKLVKALVDVSDWRTLGIHLKVDYSTLNRIERNYSKSVDRMSQMLYTWILDTPGATWEHIVTALREMNLNSIAKSVETEHCYSSTREQRSRHSDSSLPTSATPLVPTTDTKSISPPLTATLRDTPTPPESPPLITGSEGSPTSIDIEDLEDDGLQVVEEEIGELDHKFRNLVLSAGEYFIKTESDSTPGFLFKFRIMEALFLILGRYWNWWNCSLLLQIIDSFGSQQLKDELHCYLKDLEEFQQKTLVKDFMDAYSSYRDAPPKFVVVRTHMQGDWARYTVYQIRKLGQKLAWEVSRSSSPEMFFMGVSHSSIVLIWAVPSTNVHVLAAAIDKKFLQSNAIEFVTIDGQDLSSYQSQDRQLNTLSSSVVSTCDGGTCVCLMNMCSHDNELRRMI